MFASAGDATSRYFASKNEQLGRREAPLPAQRQVLLGCWAHNERRHVLVVIGASAAQPAVEGIADQLERGQVALHAQFQQDLHGAVETADAIGATPHGRPAYSMPERQPRPRSARPPCPFASAAPAAGNLNIGHLTPCHCYEM